MPRRPGTLKLARGIGARIRTLRTEAGITQEKLAWSAGLAKPYLSQIEAGKRLPSLAALVVLAKRLSAQPADLLVADAKDPRCRVMEALRANKRGELESALRELGYELVAEEEA